MRGALGEVRGASGEVRGALLRSGGGALGAAAAEASFCGLDTAVAGTGLRGRFLATRPGEGTGASLTCAKVVGLAALAALGALLLPPRTELRGGFDNAVFFAWVQGGFTSSKYLQGTL